MSFCHIATTRAHTSACLSPALCVMTQTGAWFSWRGKVLWGEPLEFGMVSDKLGAPPQVQSAPDYFSQSRAKQDTAVSANRWWYIDHITNWKNLLFDLMILCMAICQFTCVLCTCMCFTKLLYLMQMDMRKHQLSDLSRLELEHLSHPLILHEPCKPYWRQWKEQI